VPSLAVQPRSFAPQGPVAQRVGNGEAFQLPAQLSNFAGGAGQPLPGPVRQKMESFFNTSFTEVRVHVGPQAASIGALAFTHGSNLYFAPGQYNPNTAQGQRLLGHELTHVVQQRAGRVLNPFSSGVAVVQDPTMEAEADRQGMRAAAFQLTADNPSVASRHPGLVQKHPSGCPTFPSPSLRASSNAPFIQLATNVGFNVEEGAQRHHPVYKFTYGNLAEENYDLDPWITLNSKAGYEGADRSRSFKKSIKRLVKDWDCSNSIIKSLVTHLVGASYSTITEVNFAREGLSGMSPMGHRALIRHLLSLEENIGRREGDIPVNCYNVKLKTKPRLGDETEEIVSIGWKSLLKDARLLLKKELENGTAAPAMHAIDLIKTAVPNSVDPGISKLRGLGLLGAEMELDTKPKRHGQNLYTASGTGSGQFNFGYGHLRFILYLEWRIVHELQR
jgi:Domain of unknown function (DUF4157)